MIMKIFIAISILVLSTCKLKAQNNSDLYLYVDSLIKYDLKFKPNAVTHFDTVIKKTNTSSINVIRCFVSIPPPSFPLIVVNNIVIEMDKLNKATLRDTKSIAVVKEPRATALYGSSGMYGVIYISGNNKLTKKILPN